MHWDTLRKTYIIVGVNFRHHTHKVFAENIRVRIRRDFEISIDLNKNLRTRSKGSGTCVAAMDLARDINSLKYVQILDRKVIEDMGRYLDASNDDPERCRVHVALQGDHWFDCHTELKGQTSLFLHLEPAKS